MYNRRLKIMLAILSAAALAVVGRLTDLQAVHARQFQQRAAEWMRRPSRLIPTVRGRIIDRQGQVLAEDQPRWELRVDYGVLDPNEADRYFINLARRNVERRSPSDLRQGLDTMWTEVEELTGVEASELHRRQERICRRVHAVARAVSERRGIETRIEEQETFHPIVGGLSDQEAIDLRLALEPYPWAQVCVANKRAYRGNAEALCHILGILGPVTREVIDDPNNLQADVLNRYWLDDTMGYSGVERLGERILRGRRGLVREDFHGNVLERIEPQPGRDLRLTIDADLQDAILHTLADAVQSNPDARGGGASAVVLDVETRHVLALVSYPTFDPDRRTELYEELVAQQRAAPLLARAVSATYNPGSVIKPIALAAALSTGVVSPSDKKLCTGRLFEDVDGWHCWTYWRHLPGHGWVDASDAIKKSCNVYFYKIAQEVGPDRLVRWLERFGLGRDPGTGLIEERSGIVPARSWREQHGRGSLRVGDARNLAIGQGDLTATPLHVANIAATVATGRWLPPTILMNDWRDRPMFILDLPEEHWRVIREGMYRAVNEPGGTAYHTVRMEDIEVCGKTGSAQTGQTDRATHAWFMGYAPYRHPKLALAVVIEHGGSGGRIAGPVARQILAKILDDRHDYLLAATRP
jgi:penicillin-binding protein 2